MDVVISIFVWVLAVCFFKQKTAYEMRISDWSSDVCSSDLYVQADAPYRSRPEDLGLLYVRGQSGEMTPLTAFASSYWKSGPALLERYNGAPSFEIDGQAAPGYSSGTALKAMEELAKKNLPADRKSVV